MKKLKIVLTLLILLLPVLPLSSVTPTQKSVPAKIENSTSTSADVKKIHIIFATGGLGDKSFNDAGFRGYVEANESSWAANFTLDYVEPETVAEFADYQKAAATKAVKYDLIICVGFLQLTALNQSAQDYPSQNFTLIDDQLNFTNVRSVLFKEEESAFLVGAMAAMTTETDKIGFLGGLELFLILKFLAGYEQGAHYINPNISVTAMFSPNPTNPWGDIAGGKNVGTALLNAGNDVIFAAAGGTGIGVFQAVNATDDAYAIGVDSDQDGEAKGKILCSMLKLVETAVFNSIRDTVYGNWTSGTTRLGLEEGGVGISPMTYTQTEANTNFVLNGVTKSRWDHVQDIRTKIINGTISVDEAPDWNKIAKEQLATPGFEVFLTLVALLGFAAIQIKRKRSRR
ncbi:MAG: BMP family lipoprotein [Candidatus Hodarchaeales archaeon]